MENNPLIQKRLQGIEQEIYSLKSLVIQFVQHPEHTSVVQLQGVLRGMVVKEKEVKQAKKSLFPLVG